MKWLMIILMICALGDLRAQKFFTYRSEATGMEIKAGDTIRFLEGSMDGLFVHVYTVWGKVPPVKAPFQGSNSYLIINHFRRKRENGIIKVYAVSFNPGKEKVLTYTDIESAIEAGEITSPFTPSGGR